MNKILPFLAVAIGVAVALSLVGLPDTVAIVLQVIGALLAVVLAIELFRSGSSSRSGAPTPPEETPGKPSPAAEVKGAAEDEVITFLARLQEKGRLIDFLMDDIAAHDDAAIGAAARVVHQGCRAVIDEHFTVEPVEKGTEGGAVTVPAGYDASLYRLTGNLGGSAPFSGTLVHRGWKVTSARLPKVISSASGALPPLAPAEVEV